MLYVGIDVAKNKHDCCIIDGDGVIHRQPFEIGNDLKGFLKLKETIDNLSETEGSDIKIGLEPTGHYSMNITEFFVHNDYDVITINPLLTNLYRKARTLRKTKTDKTDAMTIAEMLTTNDSDPYVSPSYQMESLKSLSRHRRRLVKSRSKLKVTVKRVLTIVFPELEGLYAVHGKGIYAMLQLYPDASAIAQGHITTLTNLLKKASHGRYGRKEECNAQVCFW